MSGAVIIQTNLLKLIVSLMAMAIYMQKNPRPTPMCSINIGDQRILISDWLKAFLTIT